MDSKLKCKFNFKKIQKGLELPLIRYPIINETKVTKYYKLKGINMLVVFGDDSKKIKKTQN